MQENYWFLHSTSIWKWLVPMYPDFVCALSTLVGVGRVLEGGWIAAQFVGFHCHQDSGALALYSVFKMKLGRKLLDPVSVDSLQLLLLQAGLPSGLSNSEKTSQLFSVGGHLARNWHHCLPQLSTSWLWFKFWGHRQNFFYLLLCLLSCWKRQHFFHVSCLMHCRMEK